MTLSIQEITTHLLLWGFLLLPMLVLTIICLSVLIAPYYSPRNPPRRDDDDEDDGNGGDGGQPKLPHLPTDWHGHAKGVDDFSLLKDLRLPV